MDPDDLPSDALPGIARVIVTAELAGQRLDRVLAAGIGDLSRTRVRTLLADGHVRLGGVTIVEAARRVKAGQVIEVDRPPPRPTELAAEPMPLAIIHEDAALLVIDKPAGLVVHPGPGNPSGTLVNGLMAHCGPALLAVGGPGRPGLVHRLDKDTSGLMVVAKTAAALAGLAAQFADRSLSRHYRAVVWGLPLPAKGAIDAAIGRDSGHRTRMGVVGTGGKPAVTHYRVTEAWGRLAALVECRLETGRTHQIRVHMAHLGHGLIGDPLYGRPPRGAPAAVRAFPRQALHAYRISFCHPDDGRRVTFASPMPEDIEELMTGVRDAIALTE